MMFNPIIVFSLIVTVQVETQSSIRFDSSGNDRINGDRCVTVQNGVEVNGTCIPIEKCPSILANVLNRRTRHHDVCGYDGESQIVCCPCTKNAVEFRNHPVELNLIAAWDCKVTDSNEIGVMKFLSDCPVVLNNTAVETNKLCDYEICSDLICCPGVTKSRLKKICANVDEPYEMLYSRLNRNQECTVTALNLKGVYQQHCDYVDRHPNLRSILNNVCNDRYCKGFYCCPIEGDDQFYCTHENTDKVSVRFVGPKCVDSKSGRQGTCRRDKDLRHRNFMSYDICGTYCCRTFYCDPDTDSSAIQTIATRECTSYTKYLTKEIIEVPMNAYINQTKCSGVSPAGGTEVQPGEYPHMAALGYEVDKEIAWNCGGSLISDRYVLTAAHCLTHSTHGTVKKVRLGCTNLLIDLNTWDCPEDFDVAGVISHPEYNSTYVYNDIGLVELIDRVKFNFDIRPICLPSSSNLPTKFISMGWGALGTVEDKTVKLIKINQELFPYEECQEYYENNKNRRLNRGILNDTQICAGSKDSIQSTCAGDSGGPLLARHDFHGDLFYIHGVVSFGTICGFADTPGLYTNVFPYVKWIEGIVWRN